MVTKKEILSSEKELQERKKFHRFTDEEFEKYKKFLSDPDHKFFCSRGYYYIEITELDDGKLSCAMGRITT